MSPREIATHKAHCFMIVQPEGEFMGCKYGLDQDCPARRPYPDERNLRKLGSVFGMPIMVDLTDTRQDYREHKMQEAQKLYDLIIRKEYFDPLLEVRIRVLEQAERYERSPGNLGEFKPIVQYIDEKLAELGYGNKTHS